MTGIGRIDWKQECIKERRQRKSLEKENTELIGIIIKLTKKSFYALTLRELRKLDKIMELREIKEND